MELEAAVVFIDEVEEIAGSRAPGVPVRSLTRRDQRTAQTDTGVSPARRTPLMCATNSVRSLDSAFLRPGRFDYIIPVGPPDDRCPRCDLESAISVAMTEAVEVDKLVEASAMFTPADIEFAARKGAQCAFEREIEFRRGEPARTDDYLSAIADTRPTLTDACWPSSKRTSPRALGCDCAATSPRNGREPAVGGGGRLTGVGGSRRCVRLA